MTAEIRPAVRRDIKALIMLAGESGGGKTYSAILLARGLVRPKGKIGFLDTESGRGAHYADLASGYDIMDMTAPFTPQRYMEAIEAFESAGYEALIIDSISHEWEGEGGCVEMAEAIEMRTGKSGLHCWNKPKAAHKKFINRLLRARLHIIVCARAREKSVQKGKDIVSVGVQPIVEKNFPFEMLISAVLHDGAKGVPDLRKCPEALLPAFPQGVQIGVETGQIIGKWLAGGAAVDTRWDATAEAGREAARKGSGELKQWWTKLDREARAALANLKDGELKSIATAADQLDADIQEAVSAGGGHTPTKALHDPIHADDIPGLIEIAWRDLKASLESATDAAEIVEAQAVLKQSEAWLHMTEEQQKEASAAVLQAFGTLANDAAA
jgi:hypothetical protein